MLWIQVQIDNFQNGMSLSPKSRPFAKHIAIIASYEFFWSYDMVKLGEKYSSELQYFLLHVGCNCIKWYTTILYGEPSSVPSWGGPLPSICLCLSMYISLFNFFLEFPLHLCLRQCLLAHIIYLQMHQINLLLGW